MAEIKNSFLKSKMNKDLDDRLIPNGEYRDAQNISVGKSEDDDIGALETILGNKKIPTTDIFATGSNGQNYVNSIGYKVDDVDNELIIFLTNFTDPTPLTPTLPKSYTVVNSGAINNNSNLTLTQANADIEIGMRVSGTGITQDVRVTAITAGNTIFAVSPNITIADTTTLTIEDTCYIYSYNTVADTYTKLVEGNFLNFSNTNPGLITGVSLIENLLFWTDNRNQPRKINVRLAADSVGTYYAEENHISVAKYNPWEPISMLTSTTGIVQSATATTATVTLTATNSAITVGMRVIGPTINGNPTEPLGNRYAFVKSIAGAVITLNYAVTITNGSVLTFLTTTMTNKESNTTWPGDKDYLQDKFVRFSYRYQYDDGEYSLIAPFTQIAFIPKQDGFLVSGDEENAYRSTVLEMMENNVQNVQLFVPLPDQAQYLGNGASDTYKIINLDIIYKESDGLSTKILETIPLTSFNGDTDATRLLNYYVYDYQSRKPYKTLPTIQTTRVFDKVPVKAQSQETSGNRVIYGNFFNQWTPPSTINYLVGVSDKQASAENLSFAEYPNHSLKQNRTYQVGFILSDKWGRQSPVILSSVENATEVINNIAYGGSTIYNPYKDSTFTETDLTTWFGDALELIIKSEITSGQNSSPSADGTEPGLYAVPINGSNAGYNTAQTLLANQPTINAAGTGYTFKLNGTGGTNTPVVGSYLRGVNKDYVKVTSVSTTGSNVTNVVTDGRIDPDFYLQKDGATTTDNKFAYTINYKGWYSYKIVVKQQEQEYYNCYLPGILQASAAGYSLWDVSQNAPYNVNPYPIDEAGETAHIVLINDNINKIPRDLTEVGPEQRQFRSSVQLFGRVQNHIDNSSALANIQNFPFNPITSNAKPPVADTVIAIGSSIDLNFAWPDLTAPGRINFYNLDTNPLIGRISTAKAIGVQSDAADAAENMQPFLAIYETEPVESLLDIYWESTTAGLISDINANILNSSAGATETSTITWNFNEGTSIGSAITNSFTFLDSLGVVLTSTSIHAYTITSGAVDRRTDFVITPGASGTYVITTNNTFYYGQTAPTSQRFIFTFTVDAVVSGVTSRTDVQFERTLENIAPSFTVGSALPDINTTIAATALGTLSAVNGSANTGLNTQQLKWTLSGTGSTYFTLGETTGVFTKSNTTPAGTYNLTVLLEDTWNGSEFAAVNPKFISLIQKVVIPSSQTGTAFPASNVGALNSSCNIDGSTNVLAITLYHTGAGGPGSDPSEGDTIYSDSFGTTLASAGYYTINTAVGNGFRKYIKVTNGTVDAGFPAMC